MQNIPNISALLTNVRTHSVICLSSVMHHKGCTEWESAVGGHAGFPFRSTYADSKLAMVLLAKVRAVDADETYCLPPPPSTVRRVL